MAFVSGTPYIGFGLQIESSIPIIGALPGVKYAGRGPDLVIDYAECIEDIAPLRKDGPYQWDGKSLIFTHASCARYRITANRIDVRPVAGSDKIELAQILVATAIPAALWLRGQLVMHAAFFALPGRQNAIALAGPSGIGKSTLLYQLYERGACIGADDTCIINYDNGIIRGMGLPGCISPRLDSSAERGYLPVPPQRALSAAPLAALYLIDMIMVPVAVRFQSLKRREKLETLLQNRHRPRVPRILRSEGKNLAHIVHMADRLPLYRWRRQRGEVPLRNEELEFLLNPEI